MTVSNRLHRRRYQYERRTNIQMTLTLFLNAHQLAGFIQRCHVHCRALQYVCMFRFIEQTYIICGDFRVRRQNGINQIGNSGFRRTAQLHRDIGQHIQIIIDNGLTGDTEQLAIGRQCNSGLFISGGDVFIFCPFTHLTQSTEAPIPTRWAILKSDN